MKEESGLRDTDARIERRVTGLLDEIDERLRPLVRKNPLVTVGAAIAAGFVVASLLSRR